eukprot:11213417-Lingulodinium_polyedra.AAC.1
MPPDLAGVSPGKPGRAASGCRLNPPVAAGRVGTACSRGRVTREHGWAYSHRGRSRMRGTAGRASTKAGRLRWCPVAEWRAAERSAP